MYSLYSKTFTHTALWIPFYLFPINAVKLNYQKAFTYKQFIKSLTKITFLGPYEICLFFFLSQIRFHFYQILFSHLNFSGFHFNGLIKFLVIKWISN